MGKKKNNNIVKGGRVNINNKPVNNIIIHGDNNGDVDVDNSVKINNNNNNYNIVYKVVSGIPDTQNAYRSMLTSLENETMTPEHIFTGFVNYIDFKNNRVVVCNIFWNDVYICDHVNMFMSFEDTKYSKLTQMNFSIILPNLLDTMRVGSFIVFKGFIQSYKRGDGSPDKCIIVEEILDVVDMTYLIYPYQILPDTMDFTHNINHMTKEQMKRYYDVQINRIRIQLEPSKYFVSQMYESMLHHVFYQGSRENTMIKNQLRLTLDDMSKDLLYAVSLLRYLCCELDRRCSPYIIFSFLNILMKPKYLGKITDKYDNMVRKFSRHCKFTTHKDLNKFYIEQASIAYNYYMHEFSNILTTGNGGQFIEMTYNKNPYGI